MLMPERHRHAEIVEASGHLIDSQILNEIFDTVVKNEGQFEVLEFTIGRTNVDASRIRLKVSAPTDARLRGLLEDLVGLGCEALSEADATVVATDGDGYAPEGFYSTTNHRTEVRLAGRWVPVERQRMDGVIVVSEGRAVVRKLRDLGRGDQVVCGTVGVRVAPEFRERDRLGFAFMTNDISSERRVESSVIKIAQMLRETKASGGRIAFVVGPVVVHTGGAPHLCDVIRRGYVDVLLAGNALAVHDIEYALFGTSLGVDLDSGSPVREGHQHHMRAINEIRRAGGIEAAVAAGRLRSGIMYECVQQGVQYVLAGSIRDDGPLPETMMDLEAAQERYAEALDGVKMVLILSTMLHGIGVGNMLPSWVRVVCVDIHPAVVTKLADRGSDQTLGVVTDVGLFLHHLGHNLL